MSNQDTTELFHYQVINAPGMHLRTLKSFWAKDDKDAVSQVTPWTYPECAILVRMVERD